MGVSPSPGRELDSTVGLEPRTLGGRSVQWFEGSFDPNGPPTTIVYWAVDELVFHLTGPQDLVEQAIRDLGRSSGTGL
jgi:hypothetical protein